MHELLFAIFFLDKFSKKFFNSELISAALVVPVLWFNNVLIIPVVSLLFCKLMKNLTDFSPINPVAFTAKF